MVESPLTKQLAAPASVHHDPAAMVVYRSLLVIDGIIAALVALFVIAVLRYHFDSPTIEPAQALQPVLWSIALFAGASIPIGVGLLLKARGRLEEAKLVLFIPVLPAFFYGL